MQLVDVEIGVSELVLCPLGDIQSGTPASDLDLLSRIVDDALKQNAYFIGMGDYVDVASPSNRKAWSHMQHYDSFEDAMDNHMREEEKAVMEILRPTKGRWFGLLQGHHFWQFQDGTSTDQHLAEQLDTEHLGQCAMVRAWFPNNQMFTTWAHHGQGGGATLGSPLTKMEKIAGWADADLILMGHHHKIMPADMPRMSVMGERGNPVLVERKRKLVCTGSYLKGYMQGSSKGGRPTGTYVEEAMLSPVSLGSPIIRITPVAHHGVQTFDIQVLS